MQNMIEEYLDEENPSCHPTIGTSQEVYFNIILYLIHYNSIIFFTFQCIGEQYSEQYLSGNPHNLPSKCIDEEYIEQFVSDHPDKNLPLKTENVNLLKRII